ncbi:MAG TPA: dTDP-4-dehydrorhamnose 3,5-epimerase [Deltaproteobacteria bacterium]|nr:dTDP-4-dehydrorhamnose 3,5-epimerase [Deltaproteobacteria bacterium]HCP46362.1 dTDP-4-dehydrorhamnose 3,5-epimerase [Deltaproteobacteria bacterium]
MSSNPWPCVRGPVAGVEVVPLARISDERGTIHHMLKHTDPHFQQFGEIYFSSIHPGVVKGWHRHRDMTLNYACIHGRVKVVVYDCREESDTHGHLQEVFLGPDNYALVVIPPDLWNGFKGIGDTTAIVANCCTHAHDPRRSDRMDPLANPIPYSWDVRCH